MDLLAFVLALQADGKTSSEIRATVYQYIQDNPGIIDQDALEAILGGRLDDIETDVGVLKSAIEDLEEGSLSALGATAGQVPTADGNGSWTWATPSGGGSGGGGNLVVHDNNGTLDKTWKEIHDALGAGYYTIILYYNESEEMYVHVQISLADYGEGYYYIRAGVEQIWYKTDTENGYPVVEQ